MMDSFPEVAVISPSAVESVICVDLVSIEDNCIHFTEQLVVPNLQLSNINIDNNPKMANA